MGVGSTMRALTLVCFAAILKLFTADTIPDDIVPEDRYQPSAGNQELYASADDLYRRAMGEQLFSVKESDTPTPDESASGSIPWSQLEDANQDLVGPPSETMNGKPVAWAHLSKAHSGELTGLSQKTGAGSSGKAKSVMDTMATAQKAIQNAKKMSQKKIQKLIKSEKKVEHKKINALEKKSKSAIRKEAAGGKDHPPKGGKPKKKAAKKAKKVAKKKAKKVAKKKKAAVKAKKKAVKAKKKAKKKAVKKMVKAKKAKKAKAKALKKAAKAKGPPKDKAPLPPGNKAVKKANNAVKKAVKAVKKAKSPKAAKAASKALKKAKKVA